MCVVGCAYVFVSNFLGYVSAKASIGKIGWHLTRRFHKYKTGDAFSGTQCIDTYGFSMPRLIAFLKEFLNKKWNRGGLNHCVQKIYIRFC